MGLPDFHKVRTGYVDYLEQSGSIQYASPELKNFVDVDVNADLVSCELYAKESGGNPINLGDVVRMTLDGHTFRDYTLIELVGLDTDGDFNWIKKIYYNDNDIFHFGIRKGLTINQNFKILYYHNNTGFLLTMYFWILYGKTQ